MIALFVCGFLFLIFVGGFVGFWAWVLHEHQQAVLYRKYQFLLRNAPEQEEKELITGDTWIITWKDGKGKKTEKVYGKDETGAMRDGINRLHVNPLAVESLVKLEA